MASSPGAKNELTRLLNTGIDALDAPQGLVETPEYQVDASAFFANPFTKSSLLASTGGAALELDPVG